MQKIKFNNIDEIVNSLKNGKVIAIPTDTVYGFSCLAINDQAVEKIYKLKRRDEQKSFIVLVSKNYDLKSVVEDEKTIELIKKNSPAPLTMVVKKNANLKLSKYFTLPTIAIRIPENEFLQNILEKVGMIVSTSCNVQGEKNINDYKEIENTFGDLDVIVEYDNVANCAPSTIVDLTQSPFKILRQGDFIFKE